VADEHRIRGEIAVDVLVYLEVILVDRPLCHTQTDGVLVTEPSRRCHRRPEDGLEFELELRRIIDRHATHLLAIVVEFDGQECAPGRLHVATHSGRDFFRGRCIPFLNHSV